MAITTPKNYVKAHGWWVGKGIMPECSVLPHLTQPGAWEMHTFKREHDWDLLRHVQGWKLHVHVMPLESEPLFDLLSPLLCRFEIFHKFLPFNTAWNQDISASGFQKISSRNNAGEGKNCTIYTEDPDHLALIVRLIDGEVLNYRQKMAAYARSKGRPDPQVLRPFPGGTKGNKPVGVSGLVSTRYGGFTNTGKKRRIYNNKEERYMPDRAYTNALPEFVAANVPGPIRALFK